MTDKNISVEILEKYFSSDLTDHQRDQFAQLDQLYRDWNERVNIISRKDIDNLYPRHVLHSLAIAKYADFKPGTEIIDLGTGGGFPGVPLAIYFPQVRFRLIDGTGKKIRAVQGIIETLGLTNAVAQQVRAEDLRAKVDFVVCRAVATMDKLVNWSRPLIKMDGHNALPNGLIALKGGNLTAELAELPKSNYVERVPFSAYFDEPIFEHKAIIYWQR